MTTLKDKKIELSFLKNKERTNLFENFCFENDIKEAVLDFECFILLKNYKKNSLYRKEKEKILTEKYGIKDFRASNFKNIFNLIFGEW